MGIIWGFTSGERECGGSSSGIFPVAGGGADLGKEQRSISLYYYLCSRWTSSTSGCSVRLRTTSTELVQGRER